MGFCRVDLESRISKAYTTKIRTGLCGSAGNKGGVGIRFNVDETSFILLNCHLESGKKKKKERVQQTNQIISCAYSTNQKYQPQFRTSENAFNQHNVKIFFGDLNFRVDANFKEAKAAAIRFNDKD